MKQCRFNSVSAIQFACVCRACDNGWRRRSAAQRVLQVSSALHSAPASLQLADDVQSHARYHIAAAVAEEPLSSLYNCQHDDSWTAPEAATRDLGVQVTQVVSPDTTLTAFCQLAAIRLGVQRCGISLISRYQQYILAESTRTTNLADTTKSDNAEDSLWMGMTECERHGNLCENTVALPSAFSSEVPPCFTVLDLRDSRFQGAPYVTGIPFMRFYCGTPLSTDKSANIGSFWVLDNRLVPEFTSQQKKCFGTIASLVMKHLVMTKENSERRKAMRMSEALSAFVAGKVPLAYSKIQGTANWSSEDHESPADQSNTYPPEINGQTSKLASGIDEFPALTLNDPSSNQNEGEVLENGSRQNSATFDGPNVEKADLDGAQAQEESSVLFARASFLMKHALEATGCIFLDTAIGSLAGLDESQRASNPDQSPDRSVSNTNSMPQNASIQQRKHSTPGLLAATSQNVISAEVLGYAIENRSSLGSASNNKDLGFTPLDEQFLLDLASTYPQGTLWSFEETGVLFPVEDESSLESFDQRRGTKRSSTKYRRETEANLLRQHFPGVRQLLFVPLYDLNLGRSTAGCFAFSNRNLRVFAVETELPFMKSFINNVAAEISRMDVFALSSSKSDFIGSISHELRSPLHGVLAACEFLSETELSNYQRSLIETQISCGKTLLQVIEQVLDFSKINSFEKDERSAARRHGSDTSSEGRTTGLKMPNLFEQTDVCELCEEVVEGSVAGKAHLSTIIGIQSRKSSDSSQLSASPGNSVYGFTKNVAVILDFDYQVDWVYVVQPGALRRILMNVLGNALKYTQAGCIRVKLCVRDTLTPGNKPTDVITLSVSDTGKGISKEFLRKRVFTPFNQEDPLSTGCGLGLSIVKSLTRTLNGTIEIRSEQGVGTTVSINLPLPRGSHRVTPPEIMLVRQSWVDSQLPSPGTTVGYVGFILSEAVDESIVGQRESKIKANIKASVSNCMVDWLQMKPMDTEAAMDNADYVVILVDESLSDFIRPYVNDLEKKQPRVIALLPSEISRRGVESTLGESIRAFEVVSAPFGPRKMARAVAACEKTASTWSQTRRSPEPSEVAPLQRVKADVEIGSQILQAQGLTQSPPSRRGTMKSLPTPASRPKSLTADPRRKSSETTVTPRSMAGECIASPAQASGPDGTPTINGTVSNRSKARILLVDDNLINLRFLETYVKKRRHNCGYDSAENGLEAVEAAEHYEAGYSLVFMDLSMPVMDGLEATRKIRALEKERQSYLGDAAPRPALIVALTGLASSRDQANAFASGVDLFLTKPVKFKEIGKLMDDRMEAEREPR